MIDLRLPEPDQQDYLVWNNNYSEELSPLPKRLLNKWQIVIGNNQWSQNQIPEHIKQLKTCYSRWLRIGNNKRQKILMDIQHINFENLLRINVVYNFIESIENLNRIKMPKLRTLEIDNNKIREISSIRKMEANLQQISLKNNFIQDIRVLSQTKFSEERDGGNEPIASIVLHWEKNKMISHDNRWCTKSNVKCQIHTKVVWCEKFQKKLKKKLEK